MSVAIRFSSLALLALCASIAAVDALAAGIICSSRDVLSFGNRTLGSSTTATVTVSNCGDRAWSFTGVSVDPATGPEFHVSAACKTGLVMNPGDSCTIDVRFAPVVPGQTSGAVWLHNSTATPDQLVTFYGRGVDAQAGTTTLGFDPSVAVFADQAVGTPSAPLTVLLRNLGPATFTPSAMVLNGPSAYDFVGSSTCRIGSPIPAGEACQLWLTFLPERAGTRLANFVIDAPEFATLAILQIQGVGTATTIGNVSGMWWSAPPGSEAGWGVHLNHQGSAIFATWFTYGVDGTPTWLVARVDAVPTALNTFTGKLYSGTGPPFDTAGAGTANPVQVGTVTLTFADIDTATFAYTVNGVAQSKQITREIFGSPVPTCTFGAQPNLALATNYQDIWWSSDANERWWGVNLAHQGDTIFLTWFTYGRDTKPLWLVVAAHSTPQTPNVYSGTLYKPLSGPPFNGPFAAMPVNAIAVGTATLTFADGNDATFSYDVGGVAQTKAITREVFAPPGTVCQ